MIAALSPHGKRWYRTTAMLLRKQKPRPPRPAPYKRPPTQIGGGVIGPDRSREVTAVEPTSTDDDADDATFAEYNRGLNRKFVDKARIRCHAGRGGSGCISFEMFSDAWRRPSGGHGGAGGDVVLVADPSVQVRGVEGVDGGDGSSTGA